MNKLLLIGEAWGDSEERLGKPLVGPSGITMLELLHQSGLIKLSAADRENIKAYYRSGYDTASRNPYFTWQVWEAHPEIYCTNVFNLRPKPTNDIKNLCGGKADGIQGYPALQAGKYVRREYAIELDRLRGEIQELNPNLCICLGATPSWALLKTSGIAKLRGSTAQSHLGVKCLPTYHPAAVLRDWSLRPIVLADLHKAKREMQFPEIRRPQREIWIEPTISDLHYFAAKYIYPAKQLSIDLENIGPMITCIGFAPTADRALVVPFFDPTKPDKNYWDSFEAEKAAWMFVREMCSLPQIVGQNFISDTYKIWMAMGITVAGAEDTMLLHHALQPEMQKGLAFLGSIYTDEQPWKLTMKDHSNKREG